MLFFLWGVCSWRTSLWVHMRTKQNRPSAGAHAVWEWANQVTWCAFYLTGALPTHACAPLAVLRLCVFSRLVPWKAAEMRSPVAFRFCPPPRAHCSSRTRVAPPGARLRFSLDVCCCCFHSKGSWWKCWSVCFSPPVIDEIMPSFKGQPGKSIRSKVNVTDAPFPFLCH